MTVYNIKLQSANTA